jgi:hypothetical protein
MECKGDKSTHHYDSDEKFIKWLEEQKKNKNSNFNRNLDDVRKHSIVSEVTSLLEVSRKINIFCSKNNILMLLETSRVGA